MRPPTAISKVLWWKKAMPARIRPNRMKSTGTGPSITGPAEAGMGAMITAASSGILSRMTVITCVEDLRRMARKRVPRMFYEYADTGSWSEITYHAHEEDFR